MADPPPVPSVLPRLHLVTDDDIIAATGFVSTAATLLAKHGSRVALHLRGHATPTRRLFELAARLTGVAVDTGALLLVNDRVDVALAARAHGVQLGVRSIPLRDARSLLGRRLIGYSAHNVDQALQAQAEGTDFVVLGTIYASASHAGRAPAGRRLARATSARLNVPLIAIGGVTPPRVGELIGAGAYGVAVLSGVWRSDDAITCAADYLAALDAASM